MRIRPVFARLATIFLFFLLSGGCGGNSSYNPCDCYGAHGYAIQQAQDQYNACLQTGGTQRECSQLQAGNVGIADSTLSSCLNSCPDSYEYHAPTSSQSTEAPPYILYSRSAH